MTVRLFAFLSLLLLAAGCAPGDGAYDVIIRGGTIYDGEGGEPYAGDVAIRGDRIAAVGDLGAARARETIDAAGLAVSPGFVNVLSWGVEGLIEDGRGLSDVMQGVTLEVFGEGVSMGPLTATMKEEALGRQKDIRFDIEWTTLGEYLEFLETKGVTPNVASYVGATTARIHEIGYDDRPPTPEELARMQDLVRAAMREGALGVGSSLIYAPANFADTDELIALTAAAAEFGGGYISHIRSEADNYLEALEELVEIARATGAHAQVYHLKPAGEANWSKSEAGLALLQAARDEGLDVTADIYTYMAGSTGLNATMPLWVQEGGHDAWVARLKDPETRARVIAEMRAPDPDWENFLHLTGGAENILLVGFRSEALKPLTGKTLAEVAAARGASVEDTIIDLVIEDDSRVDAVYFLMSEENVRRNLAWPHTMIGSDAGARAPEGVFLKSSTHPRAYGTFARLFAKYVREEKVISVAEAVRRVTSLSADSLRIKERGRLKEGHYADIVVFDPETIQDHATYAEPEQLATGVSHVFVNGEAAVRDGEHTGATPGRVVRGPGWEGWRD